MPEDEEMLTIAPAPWRSITGSTCLQPRKTLFRLKSNCASQVSSLISTGPPGAEPPMAFTRMSILPNAETQACTIFSTCPPSSRSQIWAFREEFFSSVSRSRSASLSTAKTLAPSSAKRTAVARPLPQPGPTLPAPETMATLPSRRPMARIVADIPLRPLEALLLQERLAARQPPPVLHRPARELGIGAERLRGVQRPVRVPQRLAADGDEVGAPGGERFLGLLRRDDQADRHGL